MKEMLKEIMADVGAELKHLGAQGSHEVAAALFKGTDGFVMYPHAGQEAEAHAVEAPRHGLPPEAVKQVEVERGMEMEM